MSERRHPEVWEQEYARCRHFNGIQHERCEAGVRYDDVRGDPEMTFAHCLPLPCWREHEGLMTCPKRSFPTVEEAKAEAAASEAHANRLIALLGLEPGRWHPDGERPLCAEPDSHQPRQVLHADGRDNFTNVYECDRCGGHLVSRQQRRGLNRQMWRDAE